MLKIRLKRAGKKNQPFFRIVVADAREKRDGKTIEIIGFYDPGTDPPTIKINQKRLGFWLKRGCQPTPIVRKLMKA